MRGLPAVRGGGLDGAGGAAACREGERDEDVRRGNRSSFSASYARAYSRTSWPRRRTSPATGANAAAEGASVLAAGANGSAPASRVLCARTLCDGLQPGVRSPLRRLRGPLRRLRGPLRRLRGPLRLASRPSAPASRPSAPASRPSAPASRPSAPASRPSAAASRASAAASRPLRRLRVPSAAASRGSAEDILSITKSST